MRPSRTHPFLIVFLALTPLSSLSPRPFPRGLPLCALRFSFASSSSSLRSSLSVYYVVIVLLLLTPVLLHLHVFSPPERLRPSQVAPKQLAASTVKLGSSVAAVSSVLAAVGAELLEVGIGDPG